MKLRKMLRFLGFMAFSTNLLSDWGTVNSNQPTTDATTLATSIAAAGPIMDYPGNVNSFLVKLKETYVLGLKIYANTDGSDPSLANIKKVMNTFDGGSR